MPTTGRGARGQELLGDLHRKGEVIVRQGDEGEELLIIQSGAVEVSHESGRKDGPGDPRAGRFFGEMALSTPSAAPPP